MYEQKDLHAAWPFYECINSINWTKSKTEQNKLKQAQEHFTNQNKTVVSGNSRP
jgi:hypothetical protein